MGPWQSTLSAPDRSWYDRFVAAGRQYDEVEVREILRRAIERDRQEPVQMGREDIVGAAAELGIEPAEVDRAIKDLDHESELSEELATIRRRRKRRWLSHASVWAVVNVFLFMVDLLTAGGWWFYWPLLSWGLLVALQTVRLATADEQNDRETARKRVEKRRIKREKEERKKKRKHAEKDFEAAIERGVHSLLGAVANRVEAAADALDGRSDRPERVRVESNGVFDTAEQEAIERAAEAEAEAAAAGEPYPPERRRR